MCCVLRCYSIHDQFLFVVDPQAPATPFSTTKHAALETRKSQMKSHHHQHSPFHISVSPPSSGLRSARGDAGLEWAAPAGPGGCMTMCDDFDIYKTGCECAGAQEQQHALAEQDIARARQQSLILRLYVAQCPADVSSCVSSCVSSVMLVAGPSG